MASESYSLSKTKIFTMTALLVVAVHIFFFIRLHVHPFALLAGYISLVASTMLGYQMLGAKRALLKDDLLALVMSYLTGTVAVTMVSFVVIHFSGGRYLSYGVWGTYVTAVIWFFGSGSHRKIVPEGGLSGHLPVPLLLVILLVGTLLTIVTVYGFNKLGVRPEWGWNSDKQMHLDIYLKPVALHGWPVPGQKMYHNFVQLFYLGQCRLVGEHSFERIRDLYFVSGLPVYLATLYLVASIGKVFFHLRKLPQLSLLVFAVAFMGAIDYPFFRMGTNSYLPMINFSGYYHNTTLWLANVFGLAGIVLFLHFLKHEKRLFTWAMFLFAGSFFFKPSFFTVFAPAAFLLFPFYLKRFNLDQLGALLVGLVLVAFWIYYPKVMHIPPGSVNATFEPFKAMLLPMQGRFPALVLKYKLIAFGVVLVLSFPLLLPILWDRAGRMFAVKGDACVFRPRLVWRKHKIHLFFVLLLVLGILERTLFYEVNKGGHGNFGWASQSALLAALPFLFSLYYSIRSPGAKSVAQAVMLWQFLNGFWKFVMFYMKRL